MRLSEYQRVATLAVDRGFELPGDPNSGVQHCEMKQHPMIQYEFKSWAHLKDVALRAANDALNNQAPLLTQLGIVRCFLPELFRYLHLLAWFQYSACILYINSALAAGFSHDVNVFFLKVAFSSLCWSWCSDSI